MGNLQELKLLKIFELDHSFYNVVKPAIYPKHIIRYRNQA